MVSIVVVLGDGLLGVERDPRKASAKQTGRATHCFLNQDFPNQTLRHHWLSNRCPHLWPWWWGWRCGGSSQLGGLLHKKCGKRTAHMAEPCSPGSGMPRRCQKEVGTCDTFHHPTAPPKEKIPKHCVLPREENEKDHCLFGRILSVFLSWAAVFGIVRDSCCRCQAHWTHYVRCLALGESFLQAPWENSWIWGLHTEY